jgi:glutamine synthetase type III
MIDPTPSTTAQAVTEWATAILTPIAVAISALIVRLILIQINRLNIKLSFDQQAQLTEVTKQAVLKVEELTAQQLGKGAATAETKLKMATDDIVKKLPSVSAADATDSVHATLPTLGLGAASPTPVVTQ